MGYRSDIGIAVKYDLITESVWKVLIRLQDHMEYKEHNGEHFMLFIIESVKWNPENECGTIINWIAELEDTDFCQVEIGEESTDMQQNGSLEVFDLCISRSISHSDGEELEGEDSVKTDLNIICKETIFNRVKETERVHSIEESERGLQKV